MNTETFDMPMWTCPACHKEQQVDDYYDIATESDMMCGYCEASFRVLYTDTVMSVTIEASLKVKGGGDE